MPSLNDQSSLHLGTSPAVFALRKLRERPFQTPTSSDWNDDQPSCSPLPRGSGLTSTSSSTFLPQSTTCVMTRGNQREQDRLKAQKKAAANAKKPKESATNLAKRKEADAEVLRAKQKKAEEARLAAAAATNKK
ncbi:hypothetical protein CPC08DRAFT_750586 [Agrocybe pediades]|nr:hypothetical protein CPC08DRAFT_750586 [Agrocybe pediades]